VTRKGKCKHRRVNQQRLLASGGFDLPNKKIFLLGVGAQKSGTSWLYQQLDKLPYTDFGPLKEYHIFDALTVPECRVFFDRELKKAKKSIANAEGTTNLKNKTLWLRMTFYSNIDRYYEFFSGMADRIDFPTKVTGDFTPTYAALESKVLSRMKKGLENLGFRVVVMFVMRDPVERNISMLRFNRRQLQERTGEAPNKSESEDLKKLYKKDQAQIRTNYAGTLSRIYSVFPEADIWCELYENMFNQDSMDRLAEIAGLESLTPNFDEMENVSRTNEIIEDDLRREVAEFYRESYDAGVKQFGRDAIQQHWKNFRFVS